MNRLSSCAKAFTLTLLTLSLTACSGTAPSVRPDTQVRVDRLLDQAIRAEQKNDIKRAEALLEESLRLSIAVEDIPATIRTLINLARLNRLYLQLPTAVNAIDSALLMLTPEMELYAEALQEKSLIELASGNSAAALEWADKSVKAEKGADGGRRLNLLGRILVLQGKHQQAAPILNKALQQNIADSNLEEQANSLRLLGIVARNDRNHAESEKLLSKALELDKNIAVSSKIAVDLEELALTAIEAGKPEAAAGYLQRAYLVHFGAGRLLKAGAVQDKTAEIYTDLKDKANADKARATSRIISEMLRDQPAAKASETTRPSKSP